MSWLTETLFPRRTDAEARAAFYADQAATEREWKEFAQGNLKRLARKLEDRDRRLARQAETITELRNQLAAKPKPAPEPARLERALRGCARYRRQLAALQWEFDDAFGLHHPSVIAGAQWQQRRQDKQLGVQL